MRSWPSSARDPRGGARAGRAAGIHRLQIPTPFAVGRVNCYLIEDRPLTLVDTGPNSGKSLDELQHQLEALGHAIEELELIVITHQHIDHVGLVEIIASRSGAEVAAIEAVVPFLESYSEDAERDDAFAGGLMLRYGIPEDLVTALRSVSRSFRGWGGSAKVTRPLRRRRAARARRPHVRGSASPRPQPLRHALLGRRAPDPDLRRPPDRAHLLQPAARAARSTAPRSGRRRWSPTCASLARTRELPAEILLPGPRRADHRSRRADRRALRAAPPPRREAARADRRAAANGLRARPGAVGQHRRHPGVPDPLGGGRPRRPADRRRDRARNRRCRGGALRGDGQ